MTRKDYIQLAVAMRHAAMMHKGSINERNAIGDAYMRIIESLQKQNANFNRAKFCAECFNGSGPQED